MSDDTTSAGGSVIPTPTTPVTGTPAQSGVTPATTPTLTAEELSKRIADLERSLGNAKEENDRHSKRLSTYEKQEKEREAAAQAAKDAELGEVERIKKQHADLQAKYEAEVAKRQEITARHDITDAASKLNFAHPDLAHKLLTWSEFTYDDDGKITNADDLLKTLLKNYPDLAKKQEPATTPAQTAPTPAQPAPALPPFAGRSSIPSAGTNPNGKPTTLADIQWKR